MKEVSIQEIIDFIKSLWDESFSKLEVKPHKNKKDNTWTIKIESYDEPFSLSFQILKKISIFFDTENIDDAERENDSGCETCGYGSIYKLKLVVGP